MASSRPWKLHHGPISKRTARWSALAILLAAAALRLWNLGGPSLWYDEAYSWWVGVQLSPAASVASSVYELVPPFTYFLWRGWAALTGTTEFAMRSSSALAGVLAVGALGSVTWQLTHDRRCALIALAFAAVSPPMLWAAREMRMYGALLAVVGLADWALLQVLLGREQDRRRWAWAWGFLALIALYTLVTSGFWLVGQGSFVLIVLLIERHAVRRREIVRALWAPAIVAALLYLPWLLPAWQNLGVNRGFWPGTLTADAFLSRTARGVTLFRFIEPEPTALALGVAIIAVAAVGSLLSRREGRAALYGIVTTVPALAVAYLIYRKVPKWELQHTVLFAPALVVALACVAHPDRRLGNRIALTAHHGLTRVGLAACGAAFIVGSFALLFSPTHANDDWRSLAAYVEEHRRPGEVVVVETGSVAPAWIYYAGDADLLPLPDDPLLDVTNVLHYANTAPVLNAALARAPGVWLVRWLAGVTDPTAIVETLLNDVGTPTEVPAFRGLRLSHYTLPRPPALPEEPAATVRPGVELLPDVTLWGVTLPNDPQPADAPIAIRAWWAAAEPGRHAGLCYQASLRVQDKHGNTWGQVDGPAAAGDYRTEHWPAAAPILGHHELTLTPGAPSGRYTVTLILYEMDGARSDQLALGTIEVGRPKQPPTTPWDIEPVDGSGAHAALALIGARLQRDTVTPCDTLDGWLFWEISSPLTSPLEVRVGLGDDEFIVLPTADVVPAQWELGDRYLVFFKLPIDCRADRIRAPLRIALLQGDPGESIEMATWIGPEAEIVVERAFAPPEGMTLASAQVGDGIADLLGYRLEPSSLAADTPFRIVLYWQAGLLTDTPYTVFVHVVPRGEPSLLVAQHDAWPAMGGKPTYTWAPDEVIADPHPLRGLPPGVYDVRIGLYGPDLARLPLSLTGARVLDDVLVLTTLSVD